MAVNDINRGTTGVVLPREISGEIWQTAQEASAALALSRRVNLPGSGLTIDVITGDPTPAFTAEATEKPVSRGTVSTKQMTPYKLAVIEPFSMEFRRDKNALYNEMVRRLPLTFAKKIDQTIFAGSAPGSNFDVLSGATAVSVNNAGQTTYDNLVDVEASIAVAGYNLNGFALSAQGRALLRKVKDGQGQPLLGGLTGFDNLLGFPVRMSQGVYLNPTDPTVDTVGFAGDWSCAIAGIVQDVTVDVTENATINDGGTLLHLWQRNMFAVRVEMEFGFIVRDTNAFRRLTGAATAP